MRSILLVAFAFACGGPAPTAEDAAPTEVDAPLEVRAPIEVAAPVELAAPVEVEFVDGEAIGAVTGKPSTVSLKASAGTFEIDAFEASRSGDSVVSVAGVEPARGLTWYDASDACETAGKRLCSEEEWLVACTGALPVDRDKDGIFSDDPVVGRRYPYGSNSQEGWCAASRDKNDPRPLITGNHPRCVTPDGVYDLVGLTKEWIGVTPDRAAVKGGSYYSKASARCGYYKDSVALGVRDPSIGFRCCKGEVPSSGLASGIPGSRLGDTVEEWTLPTLDGGTLSMSDLAGKPVILTFWASWCGPCRQELPALREEYGIYASEGLQIIAINVDANTKQARSFMTTTPIAFPVVLDPKGILRKALDAATLPTTVYVGRDGRIRQRTQGYDSKFRGELAINVTALMMSSEGSN